MRKLYLLLDEWNNDINFVGKELDVICRFFDVTIICNSADGELKDNIKYYIYERGGVVQALMGAIKLLFDFKAHKDIINALKQQENKLAKASESIRFYLNAYMFSEYMKKNGLLEDNAIYYSYWYFWKCMAAVMNKGKYDIKVISRAHGYDLYKEQLASGYQPYKKYMDERLDKLIFISDHGKDYYLKSNGLNDSDKYRIDYLGTTNNYELTEYTKSGSYTLVSCSTVIPLKRVELIVEALSLVDDINIKWIHFGPGSEKEEFAQMVCNALGRKSNIGYELFGRVPNDEVMKYYASNKIDAFITTSSNEGMPVSIMEAMSFGMPVIATKVGNIPYMFCDNGILLSENPTANEVADAITELFGKSEDELLKIRNNSRNNWQQKYVADVNFNKFVEEVIKEL